MQALEIGWRTTLTEGIASGAPRQVIDAGGSVASSVTHAIDLLSVPPREIAIDQATLESAADHARQLALADPRLACSIMAVVDATVRADSRAPARMQAESAFQLAWTANNWVQPDMAEQAVTRAANLYQELNDRQMAAACQWLINDLPWTRHSFKAAVKSLRKAEAVLAEGHLDEYLWECRLALVYGLLLTQQYEEAKHLLDRAEAAIMDMDKWRLRARLRLSQVSYLRRVQEPGQVLEVAHGLLQEVLAGHAPLYQGQAHFLMARVHLASTQMEESQPYIDRALAIFRRHQAPLWEAMTLTCQIDVHNDLS